MGNFEQKARRKQRSVEREVLEALPGWPDDLTAAALTEDDQNKLIEIIKLSEYTFSTDLSQIGASQAKYKTAIQLATYIHHLRIVERVQLPLLRIALIRDYANAPPKLNGKCYRMGQRLPRSMMSKETIQSATSLAMAKNLAGVDLKLDESWPEEDRLAIAKAVAKFE